VDKFWNNFFKGPNVDFIVRIRRKRKVDRIPLSFPLSNLILKTSSREERLSSLMK
jgi:hypothetical protein